MKDVMRRHYEINTLVVLLTQRYSPTPSPHAKGLYATPCGDDYSYYLEVYARVVAVLPEGKILVGTKTGEQYTLRNDEPSLRRASWWERLLFKKQFPPRTDTAGKTPATVLPIEGMSFTTSPRAGWQ